MSRLQKSEMVASAKNYLDRVLLPGVKPVSSTRTGFPQLVPIETVQPISPDALVFTMDTIVEPILSSIRQHDWTNVGVVGKRLNGEVGQDSTGRSVASEDRVDPSARGIHSVYYDYERFRKQAVISDVTPLGIPLSTEDSADSDDSADLPINSKSASLCDHARGTVFIAHGYTGAWQKFDEVSWYLLRAGFNVLIVEHRGHGASLRETQDPDIVRMRDWHNYVSDFMAAVEHGQKRFTFAHPYLLIGHSMGGAVATALIEQHPDVFDRAILSSPMLMPTTPIPAWVAKSVSALMTQTGHGGQAVPNMDSYETYNTNLLNHKTETGWYEDGSNDALDARTGWYEKHRTPDLRRHTIRPSWDWMNTAFNMDDAIVHKSAIARIVTPTILFNGGKDTVVRPGAEGLSISRARSASAPVHFYHFDDGHHELFSEMPEITSRYYTTIISFFLSASQSD